MKISSAKLVKGTFLEVSFSDETAMVTHSYPHVEAGIGLTKTFMALNEHLCRMTEQYDDTGSLDISNVVCRGFYIKGEMEKEGLILTGVRVLSTGKNLTIPASPFLNMESDGDYGDKDRLLQAIGDCRKAIKFFMANNKPKPDIQGKLSLSSPENVILEGGGIGEAKTAIDIVFAQEQEAMRKNREESNKDLTEQQKMYIAYSLKFCWRNESYLNNK